MNNVTPHPGLYAMTREHCPEWCASRLRDRGHTIERIDLDGEPRTVIDHLSRNLFDGSDFDVYLERMTHFSEAGELVTSTTQLRIENEIIALHRINDLFLAIDRAQAALRAAGITGRL